MAPVNLNTLGTMQAGGYGGAIQPAASTGVTATGYRMGTDTPLIGGFLKIEYRNAADTWNDVTAEILNLGFTRRNIEVGGCAADEPSPNAIIRFQRVRTAPSTGAGGAGGMCAARSPATIGRSRSTTRARASRATTRPWAAPTFILAASCTTSSST